MTAAVQPWAAADLPLVLDLVRTAGLPDAELGEHTPTHGFVVRDDQPVGAVALEVYEESALLRSLVVHPDRRGEGIGDHLTRAAIAEAEALGLDGVYLLTETAEAFFAKRGFERVERSAAPAGVASSAEFVWACADSAIAMRRAL